MDLSRFLARTVSRRLPLPVKIVVAGGIGVGATTAVAQVSEIPVVTTEAPRTEVAGHIDLAGQLPRKTTTVALDFGCITIDEDTKLYLFGAPRQDRFGFMWPGLTEGALGALVIVDGRRLDNCLPAVAYFEHTNVPFVVGVNLIDGSRSHDLTEVRWTLGVAEETPIIEFDARDRTSVLDALLAVLRRSLARAD
jgi:signal recognition particle receptor subunit beta